jgi:hypothetical protein
LVDPITITSSDGSEVPVQQVAPGRFCAMFPGQVHLWIPLQHAVGW